MGLEGFTPVTPEGELRGGRGSSITGYQRTSRPHQEDDATGCYGTVEGIQTAPRAELKDFFQYVFFLIAVPDPCIAHR